MASVSGIINMLCSEVVVAIFLFDVTSNPETSGLKLEIEAKVCDINSWEIPLAWNC